MRVVNLFAGPGTGKSITCAALFAELKYRGHNTEMILEYAKDAAWEKRGEKLFRAQEYIFGKQHFRLSRVVDQVEFVITDSPILMGIAYMSPDFPMPSLRKVVAEAHFNYDSINILLKRTGKYQEEGRNQTAEEALEKDQQIEQLLIDNCVEYFTLDFSRDNPRQIIDIMQLKGWI